MAVASRPGPAVQPLGGACIRNSGCKSGLCGRREGGDVCVQPTLHELCNPNAPFGEECSIGKCRKHFQRCLRNNEFGKYPVFEMISGRKCADDTQCLPEEYCSEVCMMRRELGENCEEGTCMDGYHCHNGTCLPRCHPTHAALRMSGCQRSDLCVNVSEFDYVCMNAGLIDTANPEVGSSSTGMSASNTKTGASSTAINPSYISALDTAIHPSDTSALGTAIHPSDSKAEPPSTVIATSGTSISAPRTGGTPVITDIQALGTDASVPGASIGTSSIASHGTVTPVTVAITSNTQHGGGTIAVGGGLSLGIIALVFLVVATAGGTAWVLWRWRGTILRRGSPSVVEGE